MKNQTEFKKETNLLAVSIENQFKRDDSFLQMIGFPFFRWATVYFENEYWCLDRLISKHIAFEDFKRNSPEVRMTPCMWQHRLKMYCHTKGWVLNPDVLRTYEDRIIIKDTRSSFDPVKKEWIAESGIKEMLYIHTHSRSLDLCTNYPLRLARNYIHARRTENKSPVAQSREVKHYIRTWRFALGIAVFIILSIIISLTVFFLKYGTNI